MFLFQAALDMYLYNGAIVLFYFSAVMVFLPTFGNGVNTPYIACYHTLPCFIYVIKMIHFAAVSAAVECGFHVGGSPKITWVMSAFRSLLRHWYGLYPYDLSIWGIHSIQNEQENAMNQTPFVQFCHSY